MKIEITNYCANSDVFTIECDNEPFYITIDDDKIMRIEFADDRFTNAATEARVKVSAHDIIVRESEIVAQCVAHYEALELN